MNEAEFRQRVRENLGKHYGWGLELFKKFGFSDSIAHILSQKMDPGEVKKTLKELEHLCENITSILSSGDSHPHKMETIRFANMALGSIRKERCREPGKGHAGKNGQTNYGSASSTLAGFDNPV